MGIAAGRDEISEREDMGDRINFNWAMHKRETKI